MVVTTERDHAAKEKTTTSQEPYAWESRIPSDATHDAQHAYANARNDATDVVPYDASWHDTSNDGTRKHAYAWRTTKSPVSIESGTTSATS